MTPRDHLVDIRNNADRWMEIQRQMGNTRAFRDLGYKVSTKASLGEPASVYALLHHIEKTYGIVQDVCIVDGDEDYLGRICVRFRCANEAMLFKLALNEDVILKDYQSQ